MQLLCAKMFALEISMNLIQLNIANSIKVDIDNSQMYNINDKRLIEITTVLHTNIKTITLNTLFAIPQGMDVSISFKL